MPAHDVTLDLYDGNQVTMVWWWGHQWSGWSDGSRICLLCGEVENAKEPPEPGEVRGA